LSDSNVAEKFTPVLNTLDFVMTTGRTDSLARRARKNEYAHPSIGNSKMNRRVGADGAGIFEGVGVLAARRKVPTLSASDY